jgi:hypothetical protein
MQQGGASTNAGFAAEHARLLRDRSLQFDFPVDKAPSQPVHQPPPEWLKALADFIQAATPLMKWVFWGLLAIGAALLLAFIAREVLALRRRQRPPKLARTVETVEWRPEPTEARALLGAADQLAAEGRFAEAAHILLLRSIDDVRGRRPDLVRPSLTSRDIGGLEVLPANARPAFGLIAQVVERSLFGGRPVDAEAFARCRAAYADFALPGAWA